MAIGMTCRASATALFELSGGLRFTYRGSWCAEGRPTSWEAEWRAVGPHGSATWDGHAAPVAEVVVAQRPLHRGHQLLRGAAHQRQPARLEVEPAQRLGRAHNRQAGGEGFQHLDARPAAQAQGDEEDIRGREARAHVGRVRDDFDIRHARECGQLGRRRSPGKGQDRARDPALREGQDRFDGPQRRVHVGHVAQVAGHQQPRAPRPRVVRPADGLKVHPVRHHHDGPARAHLAERPRVLVGYGDGAIDALNQGSLHPAQLDGIDRVARASAEFAIKAPSLTQHRPLDVLGLQDGGDARGREMPGQAAGVGVLEDGDIVIARPEPAELLADARGPNCPGDLRQRAQERPALGSDSQPRPGLVKMQRQPMGGWVWDRCRLALHAEEAHLVSRREATSEQVVQALPSAARRRVGRIWRDPEDPHGDAPALIVFTGFPSGWRI